MRTRKLVAPALALLAINRLREVLPSIANLGEVHEWHASDNFVARVEVTGCYSDGTCVTVRIEESIHELYISSVAVNLFNEEATRIFRFVYQNKYPSSCTGWVELDRVIEIPFPLDVEELWLNEEQNFPETAKRPS